MAPVCDDSGAQEVRVSALVVLDDAGARWQAQIISAEDEGPFVAGSIVLRRATGNPARRIGPCFLRLATDGSDAAHAIAQGCGLQTIDHLEDGTERTDRVPPAGEVVASFSGPAALMLRDLAEAT